jgi:hypothetical protein
VLGVDVASDEEDKVNTIMWCGGCGCSI